MFVPLGVALVGREGYIGHMFEDIAEQGPAGFLTAVSEQLAKLPSQLWRTDNDGFAAIAAAMDALAVQVDCARVGLVQEAQSRGVVDHSSCPSAAAMTWLRGWAQARNQVIAAAVAAGTLTVRK